MRSFSSVPILSLHCRDQSSLYQRGYFAYRYTDDHEDQILCVAHLSSLVRTLLRHSTSPSRPLRSSPDIQQFPHLPSRSPACSTALPYLTRKPRISKGSNGRTACSQDHPSDLSLPGQSKRKSEQIRASNRKLPKAAPRMDVQHVARRQLDRLHRRALP